MICFRGTKNRRVVSADFLGLDKAVQTNPKRALIVHIGLTHPQRQKDVIDQVWVI